ncbi:MAG: hypothetical protein LBE76_03730 [Nitrososphaerota archaeon]|nr:hypothetical protein [Nitrososphaerota archaeon]
MFVKSKWVMVLYSSCGHVVDLVGVSRFDGDGGLVYGDYMVGRVYLICAEGTLFYQGKFMLTFFT